MTTAPTAVRIKGLDGLRALSIALVLIGHAKNTMGDGGALMNALAPYIGNARIGVMIFFVISGYLITRLLLRERQQTGQISLKAFYLRRALRIFPAFYTYILVIALLAALGYLSVAPVKLLSAATFSWNYAGLWMGRSDDGSWFLGHFWSLALEEQFYLLWPPLLALLGLGIGKRTALAICLAAPLLRVGTYLLWPEARPFTTMMLHTAADALMYGSLAALLAGNPRFERWVAVLTQPRLMLLWMSYLFCMSPLLTRQFGGMYFLSAGMSAESFCIALLLLWATRTEGLAERLLNAAPVVWVGTLSYSLYLWQQLFLSTKATAWATPFPVNLALAFLAAWLSYTFVEKPFLRLKDRQHKPVAVADTA